MTVEESIGVAVEIKQCHIDSGIRLSRRKDPIALALLDAFPDCNPVVSLTIRLTLNGKTRIVKTPDDMSQFILDFDDGKTVQPTTFKF
jgi:hypothetical protein